MLSNKHFIVVGLGKSGTAAIKALLNRNAKVTAYDENVNATSPVDHPKFSLVTGPLPTQFPAVDSIVVSPGIPLSHAAFQLAQKNGTPVFGEIELGFRLRPQSAGPLLGITGTNGKSTTTALLGEIVKHQFPNTFVGGNLGTAFCTAFEHVDSKPFDFHVVEMSSFQLEGIVDTSFLGAAILNLTADHIERYSTLEAYGDAKARIFLNQPKNGFAVLNADDVHCQRLETKAHVPVSHFSISKSADAHMSGVDEFSSKGIGFRVKNRALRGNHNSENAMAAVLMAQHAGIKNDLIQRGLDTFGGLPHRLEFVREVRGVEWINDSKATNVDSSLVAINAMQKNVWLILGGKGKGAPYAPLVKAAKGKVKGILTIGSDAPVIKQEFMGEFDIHECGTLSEAVKKANRFSQIGDTVLLSPACASYDQFKNFEHRGDAFKVLVKEL
jgi:UDP-N-acetylmuramoylalanine--D-glutamate ligase